MAFSYERGNPLLVVSKTSLDRKLEVMIDSGLVGEVPRGEKILYSGTDPKSYSTEHTLVYEDTGSSWSSRMEATQRLGW